MLPLSNRTEFGRPLSSSSTDAHDRSDTAGVASGVTGAGAIRHTGNSPRANVDTANTNVNREMIGGIPDSIDTR